MLPSGLGVIFCRRVFTKSNGRLQALAKKPDWIWGGGGRTQGQHSQGGRKRLSAEAWMGCLFQHGTVLVHGWEDVRAVGPLWVDGGMGNQHRWLDADHHPSTNNGTPPQAPDALQPTVDATPCKRLSTCSTRVACGNIVLPTLHHCRPGETRQW